MMSMKQFERKKCRVGGMSGIRNNCSHARYFVMSAIAILFVLMNISISAFASNVVQVFRTGVENDAKSPEIWLDPTYDFLMRNAKFAQSGDSYSIDYNTNKIYTNSNLGETNNDSFTLTWDIMYNPFDSCYAVLTVSNVTTNRNGSILSDDTVNNTLVFGSTDGNASSYVSADIKLSFVKRTGELITDKYLLSFKDLGSDASVKLLTQPSGDVYLTPDSTISITEDHTLYSATRRGTNPYSSGFATLMRGGDSYRVKATKESPVALLDNIGAFYIRQDGLNVTCYPDIYRGTRKEDVEVSVTPDKGYKITSATMDGTSVLNGLMKDLPSDAGYIRYRYRIGTLLANHILHYKADPISYVIDFDNNGGEGEMNPIPAVYDTAKRLPSCTFTKPDCTFTGWVLEGTSSPIYRDMESVKNLTPIEGKRVKLVAQWTVPTCTVTFMNGHTNSVMSVVSVIKGNTVMAPSYPTYTGYTALGWDKSLDNITTDTVITARYRPNAYKVIFNKNAAGATGTMSPLSMEYGTKKTLTANAFSYSGHAFASWTTQPDGTGARYSDMQSVGNLTDVDGGTVNLYAQWTALAYTVTFVDGYDGSTIKTAKVSHGDSVTAPSFPSHIGYTATGWDSPLSNITSNRTITAKYRANTYRIVFDRNADDATGDMSSMDMSYASAKNLTMNSYSRTGYTWNGWNTEANGSGTSYRNGQSVSNLVTADNGSITLYAQWVPNTYTIKFVDGHDGTAIKSVQLEYGSAITAPNAPVHAGYTATGWDKTPGNVTGDETFTMSYRANTYTVRFDKNNQAATGSMSDQQMAYGTAKKLNRNAFSYTGRTWIGWTTKSDGSGKSYKDEESVSNLTEVDGGTVTLYAQWSTNAYTVRFIDGHDNSVIKTQQVDYGKSATAPDKPVHKGYTASEWNGNYTNITKNTDITVNYSPNRYKIKFDSNGGTSGSMSDVEAVYDAKKNLPANDFSRTGYQWAGWNDNAAGTGKAYTDSQQVTNLTDVSGGNVTLYAQWTPNLYKIQFDKNRDDASGTTASIPMTYDVSKNLTANGFSSPSASFSGWNTKENGTGTAYRDNESVRNLSASPNDIVTLYAQWSTNTYAVTFIDGHTNKTIATMNVEYGGTVTPPAKPTHTGYTAASWDGNYTNVTHNENVTLSYRANSYSIAFDSNGGSGTMPNQQLRYDTSVKLDANTFTRTGYTFTGWKVKTGDASYTDRQEVTNLSATDGDTVTLVAQWKANSYTVKFDSNGGSGTMAPQKMTYGTPTQLTKNAFSNTGHTFSGWRCGDRQNGQIYRDSEEVSNLVAENGGSTTMYAQWDTNDVSVTFVDGHTGKVIEKKTVKYGSGVSAPSKPKHEGYTATAWNGDLTSIIADTTITLNYRPNRYTVKFNGNADGVNGETQSMDMEYGVTKGLTANGYSREGYDWTGWSTSPDGTGTKYNNGQDVSNLTASDGGTVNLYACWKIKRCTVTFIDGFDNTVILRKEVDYGTTVPAPEPPVHKGYKPVKSNPTVQSDMNVTIKYEPISYTVEFNGNAENVSGTTASMNMKYGAKANLTENGYSREGYDWIGWSKSSDGTGTKYSNGQEISNLSDSDNSTVTLYACWKIKRCTITFIDGFDNKVISKQEVDYGTKVPTPKAPEHKGYKVVETDQTATSDMNVTVKYEPISYTIRFDGNAANVSGTTASMNMKYGAKANLTENGYSREGYDWTGWSMSSNGTGTKYNNGQEVSNLSDSDNSTVTMYACWRIKRCTITFIDGFDNTVISKQEVDYGTKIPAPKAPEHKGYKVVETDQTAKSDMNVIVKYEPISYTVRFNGNSSSATGSMPSITMKYDESRNLPSNAFKYHGYHFAGWESGKAIYPDCAEIRNLADTDGAVITLNAKWVEDSHIAITYSVKTDDGKGNCKVSNALDNFNQTSGTPRGSTATPSEEYDFKGWYDAHGELISEKETYVPQKPGNGKWTAAAYTALFARKEFKVVFRGQDGTVLSEQVIKYGETPKAPEPPVLDGYKFVRWDGDISNITGNIDTKPIYEKITQEDSGNKNGNENADNANNNNNGNENMNNNTDKNSKDSTDQLQDGLQSILQTGVDIIVSPLAIAAASISAALAAIFRRKR